MLNVRRVEGLIQARANAYLDHLATGPRHTLCAQASCILIPHRKIDDGRQNIFRVKTHVRLFYGDAVFTRVTELTVTASPAASLTKRSGKHSEAIRANRSVCSTATGYFVTFFAGATDSTITISPITLPFTVALSPASLSSSDSCPSNV